MSKYGDLLLRSRRTLQNVRIELGAKNLGTKIERCGCEFTLRNERLSYCESCREAFPRVAEQFDKLADLSKLGGRFF